MLIILDRDGVINYDSQHYIKSPDEWIPIPGSLEAIAKIKQAGHDVVIATNQSGIARGLYTHEILQDIHNKMHQLLAGLDTKIDGVFYCPHHPVEECVCRKPEPGLLHQIAEKTGADLTASIMVGDSLRDLQAAQAVNCKPVLVRTGNGEDVLKKNPELPGVDIFDDLASFADTI